jgi:hypothetical protein
VLWEFDFALTYVSCDQWWCWRYQLVITMHEELPRVMYEVCQKIDYVITILIIIIINILISISSSLVLYWLMLLYFHHHNNHIFILLIFLLQIIIIHIYSPTLSIDALKSKEIDAVNVIELTTKYYTASIDIHLLDLLDSHASGTGTRS